MFKSTVKQLLLFAFVIKATAEPSVAGSQGAIKSHIGLIKGVQVFVKRLEGKGQSRRLQEFI